MINSTALYKPKANFRTYLFTIAHSTLVDFYRKTKPTQTIGFEDAGITEDLANNLTALAMPEDIFILKQKARQLMQALDKLHAEQKETASSTSSIVTMMMSTIIFFSFHLMFTKVPNRSSKGLLRSFPASSMGGIFFQTFSTPSRMT